MNQKIHGEWATISAWAVDLVRAMLDRPLLAKMLVRPILGKYAWREFIGLMDALEKSGMSPWFGYGLEECEYHEDHNKIPRLNWWTERKPLPKKRPGSNGKYVNPFRPEVEND